jgi:NAD(P)-dependent dehydrogenase (short-subunit alcohol dehydrogenase family)
MFDLSGKSAIVTGGAQGIGRGIAIVLAKCGADVVVTDILLDGAKAVAKEIETLGQKSLAMKVDVTQRDEVHKRFTRWSRKR